MQRPDGLTYAELIEYHRALVNTHERKITVRVLDLNENVLTSLTADILDGVITIDVDRDPIRVLDFTFLDPNRVVQFEPDSPSDAPLHRSRMIQIGYSINVPALERWVTVYPFTGPVYDFDRQGPVVTIVAHGKEILAEGNAWVPRTFPAKTKKTRVIRDMLTDAGETNMAIPDLPTTMPTRLTVGQMQTRWPKAKKLGRSMDRDLFYDGTGAAVLRARSSRPVFTFDKRFLLDDPLFDRDPEGVINTWKVVGAKPKGAKTRVSAEVALPPAHPLSPGAKGLGRNGKRHVLARRVENNHIKTKAEAKKRAMRMRDDAIRTVINYTFDSIPVAHLDEYDMVRLVCDDGTFLVRIRQLTIPLGWDGAPPMSVGSLQRTTNAAGRGRVKSAGGIHGIAIPNRSR